MQEAKNQFGKPGSVIPLERNISRLIDKEQDLDEKLLKAYMDYAEKVLDEEDYQMIKNKNQTSILKLTN